jgi:ribosomal protein S14
MKKSILKDQKKRNLYLKYEKDRKILKALSRNINLKPLVRDKASQTLASLPKDSSIVRLRNRCILTGRGRAVISGFNLSRLMLRKLGRDGLIQGLRKSS